MIISNDWYRALLLNILYNGEKVGPRGLATTEVLNVSARIPLEDNIVLSRHRRVNYRFMVGEFLWMANGRDDLAPLTKVNSHMAKFSDDGMRLAGAYGPWFKLGIGRAFAALRKDPDTRQAFVKIGPQAQPPSKDVPCTMTWQFLIRGGRLHMVANMRSSDAWLGVPYDVYSFSQIANCVAGALGIPRGFLYLNLASSHLYDEHLPGARAVAEGPDDGYGQSPELDGLPPAWTNLVLDMAGERGFSNGAPLWLPTAAASRPEFGRLAYAYASRNSADALKVLLDDGNGDQP
jgi:thymidylate synthase